MCDSEAALIAAAGRAFRRTRFYGELYEDEPAGLDAVPFIGPADYHRAAGLLDVVADPGSMIGVLPPYDRDAGRFPFAVPEDEAELVLRQRRIVRALMDLGIDFGASPRFLIVADDRRGPFACELAKGLYWEGFQASIGYPEGGDEVRREVEAHDPDYVVVASGRHRRRVIERPRSRVIVVEHCSGSPVDDREFPALLYADEVDLIGSRPAGRAGFDHDAEQLRIEVDPASGLSHVSSLQFSGFPLIRYGLGRRLPMADDPRGGAP